MPHRFRDASPYPVGWPHICTIACAWPSLFIRAAPSKTVRALHEHEAFGEAMALLTEGDISLRRREMLARRDRSDDWFFERFGLKW